ncbi:MAG: hypothetical protein ACE5K1_00915 [Acidiferrobacterales bacterium]
MGRPTLYQFFRHQVQTGFGRCGLAEPATVDYVSELLTRFAHTRALYPMHDREGRPLERIAELLAEWYGTAGSDNEIPDRHRQASVARHLGDYTLFMSGLFRDRLQARGELGYYLANGQNAFWHCAHHELNPKRRNVFRRMHFDFAQIADALDHIVRSQWRFSPTNVNRNTLLASFWRV